MNRKFMLLALGVVLIGAFWAPNARADEGNQKMIVTVKSGALALPGTVLQPGEYVMKFADLNRNVIVITAANGSKPVGFFLVDPISRDHRSDRARFDVSEAPRGSVRRLRDFFYPDTKTGYEFQYRHGSTRVSQAGQPKSRS